MHTPVNKSVSCPAGDRLTGLANYGAESGKIRLMLFNDAFARGGNERQFVHVLRKLDPAKYDISIGCLHARGAFLRDVSSFGYPVLEFPIRSFYGRETARQFSRLKN